MEMENISYGYVTHSAQLIRFKLNGYLQQRSLFSVGLFSVSAVTSQQCKQQNVCSNSGFVKQIKMKNEPLPGQTCAHL